MKYLIVIFSCLALQACTTPAVVSKADADATQKAMSFEVSKDRAKVYFVNGKIIEN